MPFAIYPPGFDTNSLTIFRATPSQVESLTASAHPESSVAMDSGGSFSPDASGSGGSAAGSQGSSAAPQRQPANPIVGISGLFGVAWDTYTANGTNAMSAPTIPNIPGVPGSFISLDGFSGSSHLTYAPLPQFNKEAGNFETEMQLFGWKHTIVKADNQLSIGDLTGSGTPFNNVSLGVLLTHGAYGNTQDYMAGLVKQMYFPITSGGSIQYLRMTDMSLGGSDPTNGLKWFAFMSCDSLHQANWNSMKNGGHVPYNSNMHMILGANSVISTSSTILQNWAQYMNFGRSAGGPSPMTVRDAFYQAAKDGYYGGHYTNTMVMAAAYDTACVNDYLPQGFNTAPQGTWTYNQQQVWP